MSKYIAAPSTSNNIEGDNLNDGSKEFNKMVQRTSNLPPEVSRKMYEYGMMKQLTKGKIVSKVQQVQTNPILQQAMKQDYLKFAAQVHQYTNQTQATTQPTTTPQLTFDR